VSRRADYQASGEQVSMDFVIVGGLAFDLGRDGKRKGEQMDGYMRHLED
jgi:hypothetical protein